MVDYLPDGKYIVADNAYINTDHLLTPYSGQQKADVAKDTYNFYLGQCRIRIEQAFGQLTYVWRVFRSPLRNSLFNVPWIIHAAMRLHNFLINERQCGFDDNNNDTQPLPSTQQALRILGDEEIMEHNRNYDRFAPPEANLRRRRALRESILAEIRSDGLQRPIYNRLRNVR
jgi:DDE superfamily endonuclease